MSEQQEAFPSGWYIVEQLGHKRLAGFVTETVVAGAGFLRVDVPAKHVDFKATQWIHPSTIYAITPTTEATARRVAEIDQPEPVRAWELPAPAPARVADVDAPDAQYRPGEELADDDGDEDEAAERRDRAIPW